MSAVVELLEMAAKAAGIKTGPYPSVGGALWDESDPTNHRLWNPLEDDGDALRLAVALEMCLLISPRLVNVRAEKRVGSTTHDAHMRFERAPGERTFRDVAAVTRRAIVRAAAEIGRAMP